MTNNKSSILLKDKIYGTFEISEPVVIELIKSHPFQRLKQICQYGVPDKYYHLKNYSRFEHSVGVYLLLKKLGASEKEQIAGLLHDVSHTAFSHVVDWVLGNGKDEGHQDAKHLNFLLNSELSVILKKYNFDPAEIGNHHNFKLLENELPQICADRIDYSIREFPLEIARELVENLIVEQGEIIFKNKESAKLLAENFLKRQVIHWGGFEAVSRYRLFANALKIALDKKIIDFNDFWKTDNYVLNKINEAKNEEINKILSALKNKKLNGYPKGKEKAFKKFRYVDPLFLENGKIVLLSKVDKKFANELEKVRIDNARGINYPII